MNVGIDIGATKTLLAGFNSKGSLVAERKFPTHANSKAFVDQLSAELHEIANSDSIEAITVGVRGAVDKKNLILLQEGLIGWQNLDLGSTLRKFSKNISLENDAKLAGLAEATKGAGKNYDLVLYVTISSGIGTAVLQNKQLILYRSEGGLMLSGPRGKATFEDLASGIAIKKRFGKQGYQIKDPATWKTYANDLAVGLYNLIQVVGPDVVVLGGGVAVHYLKFIGPLESRLEQVNNGLYPLPPILRAKFVETAVIEGCRAVLMAHHKTA